MLENTKTSEYYLEQISNNTSEKIGMIDKAFKNGELPKTEDGKIRIIELGTGGGQSIHELSNNFKNEENVELITADIFPDLPIKIKKELGIEGVAADAGALPFKDESVSAVNASAVFHEVSSYGIKAYTDTSNGVKMYGRRAVRHVFSELNRVLVPGGKVAYRDVLAPINGLKEEKEVEFKQNSIYKFAKWFLPNFLQSSTGFYKDSNIKLNDSEGSKTFTAPAGLQREVQRHYLMMRDYLRTVKFKEFGISILNTSWIDQEQGLKSIEFSADPKLSKYINTVLGTTNKEDDLNSIVLDSDKFDLLYDNLIDYYFDELNKGTEEGKKFEAMIEEWKEREGKEYYVYGNISEVIKFSIPEKGAGEYVLFPESAGDIEIVGRDYYNRYLKQSVSNAEFDGKQMINFTKIKKSLVPQKLIELEQAGYVTSEDARKILDRVS